MTVKQFFKNVGKAIVVFFAGLGACFSMVFVISLGKDKGHKSISNDVKTAEKKREEEIEKTDSSVLVDNSSHAEQHCSNKERLKQEFNSRVDSIVENFLGK